MEIEGGEIVEARTEALLAGIAELRERVDTFAATVAPLYMLLNWTWSNKGLSILPDQTMIRATLDELLDLLYDAVMKGKLDDEEEWFCSTGGLEVGYAGAGLFVMRFIVEEWIERQDLALMEEKD